MKQSIINRFNKAQYYLLLIAFIFLFKTEHSKAQKHVILIIADDLGVDYCGFQEGFADTISLPNLRSLVSRGIVFNNAMSNPLCSPTRAGIYTGRYSFRTGVGDVVTSPTASVALDTSEMCISKILGLADSVIKKAQFGKWHLQAGTPSNLLNPNYMGYDKYAGNFSGALTSFYDWTKITDGISSTSNTYATSEVTNDAIAWIQEQNALSSYFVWLGYNAPHTPYHLPPTELITTTGLSGTVNDINTHPIPYFKASMEALDHELGRLFDSLRVINELENTDFIFIGDNGNGLRVSQIADSSRAKGTIYQYGVHVPMIISGPSVISPGRASDALVNTVDLFATINELMGVNNWNQFISQERPVDSKSIVPILRNEIDSIRPWSFTELFKVVSDSADGKAIRNKEYKLIRFDYGAEEFYKVNGDPMELTNLLASSLDSASQWNYYYLCNELNNLVGSGPECPVITSLADDDHLHESTIYPNPADEYFNLISDHTKQAIILSISGHVCESISLKNGINKISVKSLHDGIYIVLDENGKAQKLIVNHSSEK